MTTQVNSQLTTTSSPAEAGPISAATPLAHFTVEGLLYALIFGLGLTLRLWEVGYYPLSNAEATQALAAWAIYHDAAPEAAIYSPLLASLNALTFFIIHESNMTVRLAPALLGSLLVLLPAALRAQLGQKTSLLTAALLALSPTAIYLSRTLNSEIAVALAGLLLLVSFFKWAESGRASWLYLLAAGLAMLLTAGPLAYVTLLIFAIIVTVRLPAFKALWQQGLALTRHHEAENDEDNIEEIAPDSNQTDDKNEEDVDETPPWPAAFKRALILFGVIVALLATAFTFNLGGLGVSSNLPLDWLGRFSFTPRPDAAFNAVFLLALYEPLLLLAGFVGLAYALLSKDLLQQALAAWFVLALLLDLLMPGRPTGSLLLPLLPLAFLAALALAALWDGLQAHGSWANEGIIVLAGLIIATFGYIGLTGWLTRACANDDQLCQLAWLQAVAALLLFLVIVGFFWFAGGAGPALRGGALTAVIVGLLLTTGWGWRLNFGPLPHQAYQPLAGVPASVELRLLGDTLRRESLIRTGDNATLDISAIGLETPALRWLLRDYRNLAAGDSLQSVPQATAILTPANLANGEANLGEAYIGQDFGVDALWSPVGLGSKDLVHWLIFRQLPMAPESNQVILWLRLDRANF